MESMIGYLTDNSGVIALVISGLLCVSVILALMLLVKMQKAKKQYEFLIQGTSKHNVEQALLSYLKETKSMQQRLVDLEDKVVLIEKELINHPQNLGIVRYNAFEGIGGEQSFSLAILDDRYNGIIMSSIFGHSETRVYAKPIEGGHSKYSLSPEENEAISRARARAGK
jgi:hypothetical protein